MKEVCSTLDRLVSFDSVSDRPTAPIIDYIEAECQKLGAQTWRIAPKGPEKPGLVVRLGPDAPGGLVLSGHCDVVPVAGQNWRYPPFALTAKGERLYGRGTTDMKGFLASMLEAAHLASRMQLARPLTLVFSYDEEIGCVGIQEMRPHLAAVLGAPRLCIVGEPTSMQVATGHKGKVALRTVCTGEAGHSALAPDFVNALHLATDFVAALRALQADYAAAGAQDAAYDIPYTTLHVGKLQGGTALNIVPDTAEVIFEYRFLPADGAQGVLQRIEEQAQKITDAYRDHFDSAGVTIERLNAYPGLDIASTSDTVREVRGFANGAAVTKVAFGTEAGVFHEMGIPTVVCGPGSMAGQGHKADEYIEMAELAACAAMLENALQSLKP